MSAVLPMSQRLEVHNNLFGQAAEALLSWQFVMNESKVCLTPHRLRDLMDIIEVAKNVAPEPS
jgi:hypothetical protein